MSILAYVENTVICGGWVAQLVGASAHTPKGCRFDSQSVHVPGLQVHSQAGCVQEATDQCFSFTLMCFSLSLFLSPPLKNQ